MLTNVTQWCSVPKCSIFTLGPVETHLDNFGPPANPWVVPLPSNLWFLYAFRPKPQRLGGYRIRVSVCPSVIDSFPGCIFVTDGRRDLGIGSYERSWPVDVPFDSFGHRKWPNLAKMSKNSGFSKHMLFQAVSLQRMVVETWE